MAHELVHSLGLSHPDEEGNYPARLMTSNPVGGIRNIHDAKRLTAQEEQAILNSYRNE